MNRRHFIKVTSAAAIAPMGMTAIPQPKNTSPESRYSIECYVRKISCTVSYKQYEQYELVERLTFANIEDAIQQIFEHAKSWDLTKEDVTYNILWVSDKGRLVHVGCYQFRDKETATLMYEQGRWWSCRGWYDTPPHTDYCAVEFG